MRIIDHPFISGVKCREDGAVFLPASGSHPGRWTFGTRKTNGYRQVCVRRTLYLVHRLICEAFHGAAPEDKQEVDHIDRNPSNNQAENLHWVDRSGNTRNRQICDEAHEKWGVSITVDRNGYWRSRYKNDPEYREKRRQRDQQRRITKT